VKCRSSALLRGVLLGCIMPCLAETASAQGERLPIATTDKARASVRLVLLESVPEFATRVRGQLSDLDVVLDLDATTADAPSVAFERTLVAIAARHAADVVAWLAEAPGEAGSGKATGEAVHIWIAGRDRIYSRRVGPAFTPSASPRQAADENHSSALDARPALAIGDEQSATLETAALFVRGAVRSVLFERTGARGPAGDAAMAIESPLPVAPPEVAVAPSSRVRSELALEDVADAAQTRSTTRLAWAPRAGLDWTYAGLSRSGAWSIDAGLGLRLGRFSVGVDGSFGFPELVRYANVDLSLRRQTLLAEVGWEALRLPRFALRPTLQAGAAWFSRSSSTSAPDRAPTPERLSLSPLVSFELVAEYELGGAFRLSASSGLGWTSHAPRYVIHGPPLAQPIAPLEAWRWQPNAGIALGAVF
jgi:hypothetical protein